MKFSNLDQLTHFKCLCPQPSIPLKFEPIYINLGMPRLNKLKSKILKRIQILTQAKIQIILNAQFLIKLIQKESIKVINRLEAIKKLYFEILEHQKFCKSEIPSIENIEKMKINLKAVQMTGVKTEIEKFFADDFLNFSETKNSLKTKFLNKHVGQLLCGVIAEDNKTVVTGGVDLTIRYWDFIEKKQICVLYGHDGEVRCLTITDDSQYLISGSDDATVRVWDFKEKIQIAVLIAHITRVYSMFYLNKNDLLVSGCLKGDLVVWDYKKQVMITKFNDPEGIFCIGPIKNQTCLVLGSDPYIVVYEIETGNLLKKLNGHTQIVWALKITASEKKLISGSADKIIIIWDLINFEIIHQLIGHSGVINYLTLTLDDQLILSGSNDCTIRVWNISTGSQVKQFNNQNFFIRSILNTKQNFITLSQDSSIGYLDIKKEKFEVHWFLKPFLNDSMTIAPDLSLIAYGSINEVHVWYMKMEIDISVLVGHKDMIHCIDISGDGKYLISGSMDLQRNLVYWDLETNFKILELVGHTGTVVCVKFSKDGLSAASGSFDNTVRTWNLKDGMQENKFCGHTSSPLSIKYMENKKLLVSAGYDKKVFIWDLINKNQYAVLSSHSFFIFLVLVTDDEKFIISGDYVEGIRVWNTIEKQEVLMFSHQIQAKSWLKSNKVKLDSVKKFLKT